MFARPDSAREIAVPASIFVSLRRALAKEAGPLPAIHALHEAGYSAGTIAGRGFASGHDQGMAQVTQDAFWEGLSTYVSRRGWGSLTHHALHDAVGALVSSDWAEASPGDDADGDDASCSFGTGFLSGLLSTVAGGPVAVLEVTCRARGDASCTFAFGNAEAIHEVYGKLLEGSDLHGAVAAL
jgi:hypothetical protein